MWTVLLDNFLMKCIKIAGIADSAKILNIICLNVEFQPMKFDWRFSSKKKTFINGLI